MGTGTDTIPNDALQQILNNTLADLDLHAAHLSILNPAWAWAGAAGSIDRQGSQPANAMDSFMIFSLTKSVTATAALLATEAGSLQLDAPIRDALPEGTLDDLHVIDGVDYGPTLTLRQLLSHRSGLADYFSDGEPIDGLPPFASEVFGNPTRVWQGAELIDWTRENLTAAHPPETGFHYSDTNYVLVGLALEKIHGLPLHEVFRREVFEPLGMAHTWMIHREEPRLHPLGALSRMYFGDLDLSELPALSSEWAGGGLVSTMPDLHQLVRGIRSGAIFSDPDSLAAMRSFMANDSPGESYGLGWSRRYQPPFDFEGHEGSGSIFMYYDQTRDLSLVGTHNFVGADLDLLERGLLHDAAKLAFDVLDQRGGR